jgi:hypothetical protein
MPAIVESLKHYVELLGTTFKDWDWVFRGQRRDWPLEPRLRRIHLQEGNSRLETERKLLRELELRGAALCEEITPSDGLEWMILGQHYGLPTRLLDWTDNAFAALWFAVGEERHEGDDSPAVVYAIRLEEGDRHDWKMKPIKAPTEVTETKFIDPPHIARRITAQSGWLSLHRAKDGEIVRLEDEEGYRDRIRRYEIPSRLFTDLRTDLSRCGISEASLFGDLRALCRYLWWANSYFDDEVGQREEASPA